MEKATCSICNTEVGGLYCGDCGQKLGRKRTTISTMILDLFSKIVSFEKSVPSTIFEIIKNPKRVVTNYMEGNRNYFSNPGALLFWALTIGALHVYLVNDEILGGTFDFSFEGTGAVISAQAAALAISCILLLLSSVLTYMLSKQGLTKQLISIIYNTCSFFILLTFIFDLFALFIPSLSNSGLGILILIFLSIIWNARVLTVSNKKTNVFLNITIQFAIISLIVWALVYFTD